MIDLHTHSVFSDATDSPSEIVDQAVRLHLSAVALTDHNSLAGIPEFLAAAAGKEITAVPGIEISTDYRGIELHIVGLFIPESAYPDLNRILRVAEARKLQNTRDLVKKLAKAGFRITFQEVENRAPGSINRNHVADVLLEKGYAGSRDEAFHSILSEEAGFYTPAPRPDVFETIKTLRSLKIVPVLAHSFLDLSEEQLREFLLEAQAAGLTAMEVFYGTYDESTMALARRIADEFGLACSGGSDYHGRNKANLLGTGCNHMSVPDEWLNVLKSLA